MPVEQTASTSDSLPSQTKRLDLLADYSGAAAHTLMHFADYDIIPTLHGLLSRSQPGHKFTIISPDTKRTKLLEILVDRWSIKNPERIQILTEKGDLTFWIRDDFCRYP